MSSTTSTATPPRHAFEQSVDEVRSSKTDLNKLVMDYLTSEGYPIAAQNFALEANMQPTPDLDAIQDRVEIREAIHSGKIQTAIEKINELAPQILDRDTSLHFSLLRLQLIELIRIATSPSGNGDITPALEFATHHLAPRAPTSPHFLDDLEQTMALLIFEPGKLAPSLAAQLDPSLRQDVAKRVNEALLESQNERTRAMLHELVQSRAWAQNQAVVLKPDGVPKRLDLGLDTARRDDGRGGSVQNGGSNGGASHQNGSGGGTSASTGDDGSGSGGAAPAGEAMATEWEGS